MTVNNGYRSIASVIVRECAAHASRTAWKLPVNHCHKLQETVTDH